MGECKNEPCNVDEGGCKVCGKAGCNGCSTGCEMTDEMMRLGNEAWAELMKEKMKKVYEKKNGEKMNKVAEVVVDGCSGYWHHMMQGKASCEEFKGKLRDAFMN